MQVQILSGVYASPDSQLRTSLPRNLVPVPKQSGISNGYLGPAEGLVTAGTGPGIDRGGINWNGVCYRVMGSKLVSVDSAGVITTLGDVRVGGDVSMDYSFDRLAIASDQSLFYWNGTALTEVTDADLGPVLDMLWVDGYFMTTDGTSLIVTELNDPTQVDLLKYGSSELDPDPVVALKKIRNEVMALNRYTIESYQNVGGEGFPFQRIDGAQIQRGCIGTHACARFAESVAFLGGGRNESPAVYLALSGSTQKLSTREIEIILQDYSETELASVVMDVRVDKSHQFLMLHLPDQTLVFDGAAAAALGEPIWFVLASSVVGLSQYRAQHFVWCYDKWIFGDPQAPNIGNLSTTVSTHYGAVIGWEFGTPVLYNEGNGAIIHEIELVSLPGGVAFGAEPVIWTSYSLDGLQWSQERSTRAGRAGQTQQRICWRRQGHMRNWRIQKFRGTSDAHLSMLRLELTVEPLNA